MILSLLFGLCLFGSVVAKSVNRREVACRDTLPTCKSYDLQTICNTGQWARENCALSCGFCQVVTKCQDKNENCDAINRAIDVCNTNREWSKENCPATCNIVCTQTDICEDKFPYCTSYNQQYTVCVEGSSYRHWAEEQCRKTCGFCSEMSGKIGGQRVVG